MGGGVLYRCWSSVCSGPEHVLTKQQAARSLGTAVTTVAFVRPQQVLDTHLKALEARRGLLLCSVALTAVQQMVRLECAHEWPYWS